jgi:hypothetical protein
MYREASWTVNYHDQRYHLYWSQDDARKANIQRCSRSRNGDIKVSCGTSKNGGRGTRVDFLNNKI